MNQKEIKTYNEPINWLHGPPCRALSAQTKHTQSLLGLIYQFKTYGPDSHIKFFSKALFGGRPSPWEKIN
jgi:hypothetical protein